MSDLDAIVEHLYGLPLEEFTKQRNAQAAELTRSGRREDGAKIRTLAKPKLSAWLVNQVARRHSDVVGRLVDAVGRIEAARSAADLRAAVADRRAQVRALVDEAGTIAAGSGRASSTALSEVESTLLAVSSAQEIALLRRGVLTAPLDASGFEDARVPALPVPPPRQGEQGSDSGAALETELKAAEERARAKRNEADVAAAAADVARVEAEAAERDVARLRARIERGR